MAESVLCIEYLTPGRIALRGELVETSAFIVRDALASSMTSIGEIDLAEVTFMDSAGIAALSMARRIRPDLRIVNPSTNVTRVLVYCGLSATICGSVDRRSTPGADSAQQ